MSPRCLLYAVPHSPGKYRNVRVSRPLPSYHLFHPARSVWLATFWQPVPEIQGAAQNLMADVYATLLVCRRRIEQRDKIFFRVEFSDWSSKHSIIELLVVKIEISSKNRELRWELHALWCLVTILVWRRRYVLESSRGTRYFFKFFAPNFLIDRPSNQ